MILINNNNNKKKKNTHTQTDTKNKISLYIYKYIHLYIICKVTKLPAYDRCQSQVWFGFYFYFSLAIHFI